MAQIPKIMDNHIYSIPGNQGECPEKICGESPRDEIENKFIRKVAELICSVLDINWNDRRVVQALLVKNLEEYIRDRRHGLLQQYLAHELENMAQSFKSDLKIPKDIKVNHDHATHAKFSSIGNYIINNFVRIDDINSDGTFKKINEKGFDLLGEDDEGDCCDMAPQTQSDPG